MIGIGSSIAKGQVINDPSSISGLVLWYDFTKLDSLRQDRDGTGAVTANDDPVEWARNLANGDAGGNILGSFARSSAAGAAYGGTFKTGGSGGQPYIQFADDASDNSKGLRSGFIVADATTDGGVASDKFSDVVFKADDFTVIQILKGDVADISTTLDTSFLFQGHETSNSASSSICNINKSHSTDKLSFNYFIVPPSGIDLNSTVGNDALDTNPHIIVTRSTSGTNNMTMQVDGTVQTDTDTPDDADIVFNRATGIATTISGAAFLSIGGSFQSGSMATSWQGGIYETIMYDRFITDDELANLEVYLGNKYGITIS